MTNTRQSSGNMNAVSLPPLLGVVRQAPVNSFLVDAVQLVDAAHAALLKDAGVHGVIQYLGSASVSGVSAILAAGLCFMPVTYADKFDGATAVAQVRALRLPQGCTVWLDLEGQTVFVEDPQELAGKINAWATAILAAGYMPGLYVGAPQPFTSVELYALKVVRYWASASRILDRHGSLAEPTCGYCMCQTFPSETRGGVWVDGDFVKGDYLSRFPAWVAPS